MGAGCTFNRCASALANFHYRHRDGLTPFQDLYPFGGNTGAFDERMMHLFDGRDGMRTAS